MRSAGRLKYRERDKETFFHSTFVTLGTDLGLDAHAFVVDISVKYCFFSSPLFRHRCAQSITSDSVIKGVDTKMKYSIFIFGLK